MKVLIQVHPADDAKAWAILQRHSPGMALPNRTFVVSEVAARTLRESGIRFTEISRDSLVPEKEGVAAGERI